MAATFGELKEFSSEPEKISAYLERDTLYFTVNDIDSDKKCAFFSVLWKHELTSSFEIFKLQ